MESNNNSRRNFIQKALMATGGIVLAPNFISCKNDGDININVDSSDYTNINFPEGLGSFDPSESSIIIWTRYTYSNRELIWELATDTEFETVLRTGRITTDSLRDNTIAVEITELESDQKTLLSLLKCK